LLLLTALFTLLPCAVLSQSVSLKPSPAYFADQPIVSLALDNASTANFTVTFAYPTTMLLLLTDSTSVMVSVPTIFNSNSMPLQSPAVNSAGLRGFLFTSLTSTCKRADSTQSGQCTIAVALTSLSTQQHVRYSLYTLSILQYGTTYTDTIAQHSWKYYVRYIQSSDLTVGFDLSAAAANRPALTTAMYISAVQSLYTPGCPYIVNGTASLYPSVDQTCLLSTSVLDVPDYYIVGLYGFASTPAASQLQLYSDISPYDSGSGFNGYAILSLTIDSSRTMHMMDPSLFQTTAGQAGVLRTDRAGMVGATEAEIAALPTKLYISSVDADGEEGEDARCTIWSAALHESRHALHCRLA